MNGASGETGAGAAPIRILRVIARLNVGGPSIQAIMLTRLLADRGYESLLVKGREGEFEGSMEYIATANSVPLHDIPALTRDPGRGDLRVIRELVGLFRQFRPDVLHTHAAKAGTVGRFAALLPVPGRPRVRVHTFHGHSLEGYFSPWRARLFLMIERFLARRTTQLVAVSPEVRDDLVRLGVGSPESIRVIRLGLPLDDFVMSENARRERRRAVRDQWGIPQGAALVTLVARLVPIKRVDRFLAAATRLSAQGDVRFLVLGDGELRDSLRASAPARALGDRIVWAGFSRDVPAACAASDVVVLTSDNEGTPVSLIEAQAAGVPVVTTRVGGAETVVRDGETGFVVDANAEALADAIERVLADPAAAVRMGEAGRRHVLARFGIERLVSDIDELYRELLAA